MVIFNSYVTNYQMVQGITLAKSTQDIGAYNMLQYVIMMVGWWLIVEGLYYPIYCEA